MIESLLSAIGLKQAAVLAGLVGGAISGAILPAPSFALLALWARASAGGVCGAAIGGYCAGPVAAWLGRPDDFNGIAFGLGLVGLSFAFKVIKTWNDFDIGGAITAILNKRTGGGS